MHPEVIQADGRRVDGEDADVFVDGAFLPIADKGIATDILHVRQCLCAQLQPPGRTGV